jgi:hypothetical protein
LNLDRSSVADAAADRGNVHGRRRRRGGALLDRGFARAFLTPSHIAATSLTPDAFWKDVDARCAAATPDQFGGIRDWAVPHFRRGGAAAELPPLEQLQPEEIGYHGPAGG